MPRVFISYRRQDDAFAAHAISGALAAALGQSSIFMDVDAIPLGEDFRTRIALEVDQCDVLVAVMGPRWLDSLDKSEASGGQGAPQVDFVRIELETALERGIPIIPVLVHGTQMPRPSDLPEGLRGLSWRNAADLSAGRAFGTHMRMLVDAVSRLGSHRSGGSEGAARRERLDHTSEAEPSLPSPAPSTGEMHDSPKLRPALAEPLAPPIVQSPESIERLERAYRAFRGLDGRVDYLAARELFGEAGQTSDPVSQAWYALVQHQGFVGFQNDPKRAAAFTPGLVQALSLHAKAGDLQSLFLLGYLRLNGIGVQVDRDTGCQHLLAAADRGHTMAGNILALDLIKAQGDRPADPERARTLWERAAEASDAPAMYNLGRQFWVGSALPKDLQLAKKWLFGAASASMPQAMRSYAILLTEAGDEEEKKEIPALFERAGEAGERRSWHELASYYETAFPQDRDYREKAVSLFERGGREGDTEAMVEAGLAHECGEWVPRDDFAAADWYEKAAEAGNGWGMHNLANLYKEGRGRKKDLERALDLWRKAAAVGNRRAMAQIGYLYENGEFLPKDAPAAFAWYKRAAEKKQGDLWALTRLGWCYERGLGTERDVAKAFECYEKAAKRGDEWARKRVTPELDQGVDASSRRPTATAAVIQSLLFAATFSATALMGADASYLPAILAALGVNTAILAGWLLWTSMPAGRYGKTPRPWVAGASQNALWALGGPAFAWAFGALLHGTPGRTEFLFAGLAAPAILFLLSACLRALQK